MGEFDEYEELIGGEKGLKAAGGVAEVKTGMAGFIPTSRLPG